MTRPWGPGEVIATLGGVLAVLGAGFAILAAITPSVPGGIFATLSSLSWLGAVYLAARR